MTLENYREIIQGSHKQSQSPRGVIFGEGHEGQQESFCKCISSKRKIKEYVGLLLNKANYKGYGEHLGTSY